MATFKVTVDDDSELGQYLSSFEQRARSREVYMLASLGLLSLKRPSENPIVNGNSQSNDLNKKVPKAVSKNSESSLVQNGIVSTENIVDVNQGLVVDFGDEIVALG
ncbi:MAG: hypothetical protein CML22_07415 [Rheinheimera sp.]|nr:hypothetical protein [Rheinheimera sp.]MBM34112.1 hypothetical protein [Rheinheimera sp.]|tara:strand:+ start:204 stop:521 length:318 start_codon:yes stop_codon:yes gene_type:complete